MRFVGVRQGSRRGMRPPTAVMCSFEKKESTLSLEPGYEFRVLQVSEGLQHVSLKGRKCLSKGSKGRCYLAEQYTELQVRLLCAKGERSRARLQGG